MDIEYAPEGINNFHNAKPIRLRISGEKEMDYIWSHEPLYIVSAGQAAKIRRHFCGVSDCRCPAGAAQMLDENGARWGIRPAYVSR